MLSFLRTRQRQPEWLDEPDADPQEIRSSLAYIRKVNEKLGYTRVMVEQFERFSQSWKPGETIRILDIGTGSADIPLAIAQWARAHQLDVRIVGIDIHALIARLAAAEAGNGRLFIVRGDALHLPFGDESFDYAITSMFLHHLDDSDVQRVLAEMGRVSRRGIIASDLLRLRRAYAFIWFFTLLSTPMVKHDARISVAQSFTREEILALRDRAGLGFADYRIHMGHRFVLAGEKA